MDNAILIEQKDIAAVVVLYNPKDSVISYIKTYIDQVGLVVAVDNTEDGNINEKLISELRAMGKITYIPNKENLGIATALNIGAAKAIQSGYKFLLTMDQDSRASRTMVADLINCDAMQNLTDLGILSPFHSTATDPTPPANRAPHQVLTAWTSGSLLNLEAYKTTGPFNEALFIDFVDHEYCLRLNLAGYKIFKINRATLRHEIGDLKRHKFLWTTPVSSNHSALRRYYITRNRFHIASKFKGKFPDFFRDDLIIFCKELIVILLFEEDKNNKYKMIITGLIDYKRSVLGKFQRPSSNIGKE